MRSLSSHLAIIYRTVQKSFQDGAMDLAATIAFYALFSVFPLLLVVISFTSYFVDSDQVQRQIYELVGEAFPGSGDLLRTNLQAVVRLRGTMGVFGVIGLLWSASAAFGAMTRAVNQALGMEPPDSYVWPYLRYLFMTICVMALVVMSVGMIVAVERAFDVEWTWLGMHGLDPSAYERIKGWAVSFLFVFSMFSIIYKIAPRIAVRWRQVVPGALLGTVIFEVGKAGFLFYLERVASFEVVYGSLSSIIVLLAWLYFSALTLVFGAEYSIVLARDGGAGEPGGGKNLDPGQRGNDNK